MRIEQIEAKAKKSRKTDFEAYFPACKPGALMVTWEWADDGFGYFELSARGEPVEIDRDEAIDVLNNLQFQIAKGAKA